MFYMPPPHLPTPNADSSPISLQNHPALFPRQCTTYNYATQTCSESPSLPTPEIIIVVVGAIIGLIVLACVCKCLVSFHNTSAPTALTQTYRRPIATTAAAVPQPLSRTDVLDPPPAYAGVVALDLLRRQAVEEVSNSVIEDMTRSAGESPTRAARSRQVGPPPWMMMT